MIKVWQRPPERWLHFPLPCLLLLQQVEVWNLPQRCWTGVSYITAIKRMDTLLHLLPLPRAERGWRRKKKMTERKVKQRERGFPFKLFLCNLASDTRQKKKVSHLTNIQQFLYRSYISHLLCFLFSGTNLCSACLFLSRFAHKLSASSHYISLPFHWFSSFLFWKRFFFFLDSEKRGTSFAHKSAWAVPCWNEIVALTFNDSETNKRTEVTSEAQQRACKAALISFFSLLIDPSDLFVIFFFSLSSSISF